jgi:hypothetical protein
VTIRGATSPSTRSGRAWKRPTDFERARGLSESVLREACVGKIKCLAELGDAELALEELAALRDALGSDIDLDELADDLAATDPLGGQGPPSG